MANNNTYNGWRNRETWLVHLWYGDSFESMVRSDVEEGMYAEDVKAIADGFPDSQNKAEYAGSMADDMADRYGDYVMEHINEELDSMHGFLRDLIDLESIDWYELGSEVVHEIFF